MVVGEAITEDDHTVDILESPSMIALRVLITTIILRSSPSIETWRRQMMSSVTTQFDDLQLPHDCVALCCLP
jgi:hypothetical protein